MVAANLMPFFIILCELFNGILQPPHQMPVFWEYTMYYITPFTYWIGGTMAMVLDGRPVVCDADELVYFELPSNTTCGTFAEPFLQSASGYISNPDESQVGEMCGYCQYASGEDVSLAQLCSSRSDTDVDFCSAVPRKIRTVWFVYLAQFWHFLGFRCRKLCSCVCFCLLADAQEWEASHWFEGIDRAKI